MICFLFDTHILGVVASGHQTALSAGRFEVDASLEQWLDGTESHPSITILPITARIAAESVGLGEDFHRDPADQVIVATARCHGLTLITADERIRKWGKVSCL